MKNRRDEGIVYSTEYGKMCPKCGRAVSACICRTSFPCNSPEEKNDGIVRISREKKGRKGKGVTIIRGIPLAPLELSTLAKCLKQVCGSGGTIKAGIVEIQGDHRDQLIEFLKKEGWSVKRSGG